MIQSIKISKCLAVFVLGLLLASTEVALAATASKQLAKGISLYREQKDEKAMDYFIDVLLNGNPEEVAEATKYIEMIHNRVGGIQSPVEVDVNFQEGEVKKLDSTAEAAVAQAQEQVREAAEAQAAQLQAQKEAAAAAQQDILDSVDAQQQALTAQIEARRLAAQEQAVAQIEGRAPQTEKVEVTVQETVVTTTGDVAQQPKASRDDMLTTTTTESGTSAFVDLTSNKAIEARSLYTQQKIASMTEAAINQIKDTKGVQFYMRDDRPDALDIDPEVIFDRKAGFRPEALPLLNNIYELLALTQGSAYVILPPGSYTDDVNLTGIRQAMAVNSYLLNRGISQGKLHYNMGLADEEPPARFANLRGLALVFDYDAKLPTILEKNEQGEKAPLLSMAVVPLCHAIDRALGEAFVIDFSVLETVDALDNWVLHVVQHGADGKFYIVRQLEGFAPVYHQILWNGRKGIIGPELPCGKYTLVLTGTDVKGQKKTVRRRLLVKCAEVKKATCEDETCGQPKEEETVQQEEDTRDYKTGRLWTKPGRKMRYARSSAANSSSTTTTITRKVTTRTIIEEDDGSDPLAGNPAATVNTTYPPATNPYDTPYEDDLNR